jgi:hypothetical protein
MPATVGATMNAERLLEHGSDRLRKQALTGWVTPIEFAKALDVKPQYIYNTIRRGALAHKVTEDTQKIVVPLDAAIEFAERRWTAEERAHNEIESQLGGS